MTLRRRLGADVKRVCEQVDDLLDSEDAIIILADGLRAISYARGFGLSACHHELLAVEIERAIRQVTHIQAVDVCRRHRAERTPLYSVVAKPEEPRKVA